MRATLIATCTGVSFAHGSNDGQKGVGIVMLILIAILPADFALDGASSAQKLKDVTTAVLAIEKDVPELSDAGVERDALMHDLASVDETLRGKSSVKEIPAAERRALRAEIGQIDSRLGALEEKARKSLPKERIEKIGAERKQLRSLIDYAPRWVLVGIALALGLGTMIGWKRIVVTIGEKIGKNHLTYAQGASAELVAAATIGLAGHFGLPVSTTHVLSSGIAGTMVAQKSGLQKGTVRNIALAWVLTLPAAMLLGGGLFFVFSALFS